MDVPTAAHANLDTLVVDAELTPTGTPAGRAIYDRRKHIVEPRFGLTKHVLGVRRFMHRGLEMVRTEWQLVCAAVNIGILLRNWEKVSAIL